jgi:hypothetical protein
VGIPENGERKLEADAVRLEDDLELTPEFEASIKQSERDMAEGNPTRVRESVPVPMRPRGYFDDCYNKAAAKESNKLATRSERNLVK